MLQKTQWLSFQTSVCVIQTYCIKVVPLHTQMRIHTIQCSTNSHMLRPSRVASYTDALSLLYCVWELPVQYIDSSVLSIVVSRWLWIPNLKLLQQVSWMQVRSLEWTISWGTSWKPGERRQRWHSLRHGRVSCDCSVLSCDNLSGTMRSFTRAAADKLQYLSYSKSKSNFFHYFVYTKNDIIIINNVTWI